MAARTENIRFNVYLNDSHAGNTMSNLNKQSKILNSELSRLNIGSSAWINKMKELSKVQRQIQGVKDEIKGTSTSMDKISSFLNHHFALITAIVAGATASVMAFRSISDTMVEFEKSFTDVTTLLSESDKIKYGPELKAGAIQIMRDYGFAIKDTNKGLFDAISSAIPAGDAINFMNRASILAVGGTTSLATSVDGLTTVMNAWSLNMDEVGSVTDAFYSAQKEGKTTVDELAKSIGTIAPVAAMAGISYQEILGSMAALTIKGISTAEAATYLRGAINGLISPGKQAGEMLRSMGVPVGITEVKTAGLAKTLTILSEALRKNPDAVGEALPNIRGMQAAVALTGEGLENFNRILNIVTNDVGNFSSLMLSYTDQQKTMYQMIERAKAKWSTSIIELTDMLKPVLVDVFGILSQVNHLMIKTFLWVRDNMGIFTALKAIVVNVTAAWTAYKIMLGLIWIKQNLLNQITGLWHALALRASIVINTLTGNLGRAAAAQRVLNTSMAVNPWALMAAIIASVGVALWQFSTRAREATDEQKRLNAELERYQQLKSDGVTVFKQAKGLEFMDADQVKRFKADVNYQLQAIKDFKLRYDVLLKEINEETNKVQKDIMSRGLSPQEQMHILGDPRTWIKRDAMVAELTAMNQQMDQFKTYQLDQWKELATQRERYLEIEDQTPALEKMSKEAIQAYIEMIDEQLKALNYFETEKAKLKKSIEYAELAAAKLIKEKEEGRAGTYFMTDESIYASRNKLLERLADLEAREKKLDKDKLLSLRATAEERKKIARSEMDAYVDPADLPKDKKTKMKDDTDAELKRLLDNFKAAKDQMDKIAKLMNDASADYNNQKLSENEKEIQSVQDKYAKMIEEAAGYNDAIVFLEYLRDAEITALEDKHKAKFILDQREAMDKLLEYTLDDKALELKQVEDTYSAMLALAEEFNISTIDLLDAKRKAEKAVNDKYDKEDADADAEKKRKKTDDELEAAVGTLRVSSELFSALGSMYGEQSKTYQNFAIFAATLDAIGASIAAFKSASEIPIVGPVLAPIAAAAALVSGMMMVKKMREQQMEGGTSPKYATGGIARGSKHSQGGIQMIDSKTGKKVGEMENGEPYMILSDKTYKNNKFLIDRLLQSSMHGNGEPIKWASSASIPQPDFGKLSQASRSYSYGGVVNHNDYSRTTTQPQSNQNTDRLLHDILVQMQSDNYRNTVIDQDNILSLRKAMKKFDKIEGRARA